MRVVVINFFVAASANMFPFQYSIANPNTTSKVKYSTEFVDNYFDVYSPPIRSQYAQVFWTMMEPVPLPDEIVKQFANKTMAITGYEADQVMKAPNGDVPVPINHAYNHHYVAWLNSEHAEMHEVDVPRDASAADHAMAHGASKYWTAVRKKTAPNVKDSVGQQIPLSSVFSEGNGGEYRGSYHGYPRGYAQLLHSPATFHINPMQIDTKNRDSGEGRFKTGPLPKAALPGVPQQLRDQMVYSGLLECPCTDRIKKEYHLSYGTIDAGHCPTPVRSQADCFMAGQSTITADQYVKKTVADKNLPAGCSISAHDSMAEVVWNIAGGAACHHPGPVHKVGTAQSVVSLKVDLQQEATLSIVGPADVWFGIGPGASGMCMQAVADECWLRPYGIIVDGESVRERYLDVSIDGGRGRLLQPSIKVVSNTVKDGLRTVVITRSMHGSNKQYYSFDASNPLMYFIDARGTSLNYTSWPVSVPDQAGLAKVGTLNFVNVDAPTCICETGIKGTLGGNPFHKNCPPPPTSDLAFQQNPTCSIEQYAGGLSCCRHLEFLLDDDQKSWDDVQEYHLKFRFYFREYKEQVIEPLVRLYWQTEAFAGEYDIMQCDEGTPPELCVQTITSRFKMKDAMNACPVAGESWCSGTGSSDPDQTLGVKLIYAGPHCHAPDCKSMELYNAQTGKLICGMRPEFGKGTETYNEEGYVALPPCVWGHSDSGAMEAPFLPLDTELLAIKRNNNTYGHYGEMASWQMRGVLVPRANTKTDIFV